MITQDIWAQAVGIAGMLVGITAFLRPGDTAFKLGISASAAVMALHFWLLGAPAGAAAAVITSLRTILSLWPRFRILLPLFLLVYAAIGYTVYTTPRDILPILASMNGTIAMFCFSGIRLRLMLMIGTAMWIGFNILEGSLGGLMLEGFFLIANIRTVMRLWQQQAAPR